MTEELCCPVCLFPLKYLRISVVQHTSNCVQSDDLPECKNSVNCDSRSLLHYRYYSHRHVEVAEPLKKRKHDPEDEPLRKLRSRSIRSQKMKMNCPGHDEDDVFVNKQKSKEVYDEIIRDEKSVSDKYSEMNEDTDLPLANEQTKELCDNGLDNVEKKEKCKSEWKSLFNPQKTPQLLIQKFSKKTKEPKICPNFKKIPGTSFVVDAFNFGEIPGVTIYFLSHFHSDHYIGLRKKFDKPIYCTRITANLVIQKIKVQECYLHILENNRPQVINDVEVTTFDANHCPGAAIILFRLRSGENYLHTGDFRACKEMEYIPVLSNCQITKLFLDTTFFNPEFDFPPQHEVIKRVRKIVRQNSTAYPDALFVSGSYTIGKEKVFVSILEVLGCKLWAPETKRAVFRCLENPYIIEAMTDNPDLAKVHVLPMNYLTYDKLKTHLSILHRKVSHIFAFRPTGWEMGRSTNGDWVNSTHEGNISIYGVPYSEHSSYSELCRFVDFLKPDQVTATVPLRGKGMYKHLNDLIQSSKGGPKQQSIATFVKK